MLTQEESVERGDLPLFSQEIRTIRNWHEWLERWKATKDVEWKESLLHCGFTKPLDKYDYTGRKYDAIDRYIFYFSIADGWQNAYNFDPLPEDEGKSYYFGRDRYGNATKMEPRGLRHYLSRKAFNMLCHNLFKMELIDDRKEFIYNWESEIISERLFPVIQNFFRLEEKFISFRIHNLSRHEPSHNEKLAIKFILNLVRFTWQWKEPDLYFCSGSEKEEAEKEVKMTRKRIDEAKPWTIEILSYLDKLDLLRKWIFELDKPCLAKLKEIALRNEISHYDHPVMEDRLVATIDEACYLGSKAGWFLKEYELKVKERKRLEEILKAEQDKEEANQKIKKLSKKR